MRCNLLVQRRKIRRTTNHETDGEQRKREHLNRKFLYGISLQDTDPPTDRWTRHLTLTGFLSRKLFHLLLYLPLPLFILVFRQYAGCNKRQIDFPNSGEIQTAARFKIPTLVQISTFHTWSLFFLGELTAQSDSFMISIKAKFVQSQETLLIRQVTRKQINGL